MEIKIQNIGTVHSANIQIGGLSVIAGHNSVGKSHIGKAVFSFLKALNLESLKQMSKHNTRHIASIILDLIQNITTGADVLDTEELKSILNLVQQKFTNIQTYIEESNTESDTPIIDIIQQVIPYDKITNKVSLNKIEKNLQELEAHVLSEKTLSDSENIFNNYKNLISSLFGSSGFSNKKNDAPPILTASSDDEVLFNLLTNEKQNDLIGIILSNTKFNLSNVTLIETPLVLQLASFIRDNLAFGKSSSSIPYHMYDLVKKITLGRQEIKDNNIYSQIETLISGKVDYNEDKDNFVYTDQQNNTFSISNTASGIKSFGLIQLLLQSGAISPDSLLIIDEPEVHLHPEWQLEYAKLLVELVKHNIPVLVTSHSPYFVEALKVYSDKEGIGEHTHFYLGEMTEKGSVFEDVTQDLDKLFEKFSAPMIKLMLNK